MVGISASCSWNKTYILPLCRCRVHSCQSQPISGCRSSVWRWIRPWRQSGCLPWWPCDSSPLPPCTGCRTWWRRSRRVPLGRASGQGPMIARWRCSIAPAGRGKMRTEKGFRNSVKGKCGRLKIGSKGQSVDAYIRCSPTHNSQNSLNPKHYFKKLLSENTK